MSQNLSSNLQNNSGLFVSSTNVWDIQNLDDKDVSPALKELLIRLYQNINNISIALNLKDSGYYTPDEFLTGQLFRAYANVDTIGVNSFRVLVNFGPLPDTATMSVAHGITFGNSYKMTKLYGAASDQVTMTYLPIPYASATTANIIELSADANNVYITTSSNLSSYTEVFVILEYLKE